MSEYRSVTIASIDVGERRREDYGDLQSLAESIQRFGLIHPVVIDSENRLVAGGRRLQACASLGWQEIEARDYGELSEAELREIELEENLRRKDLTAYERSKTLTTLAEIAASVLREEPDFLPNSGEKSAMGRPPKPDSEQRVATRLGVPRQTLDVAQQHVETADEFPFMQSPDWKQSHVLEARQHLGAIPEDERPIVAEMMSEPGVPPSKALQMLSNLRHMPEPKREKVLDLYQSTDLRDRSLAKTEAIENPASPDPRLLKLLKVSRMLDECINLFPDDPLADRYRTLWIETKELIDATRQAHRNRVASLLDEEEAS